MYEDRMALFESMPGAFSLYMVLEEALLHRFPESEIRAKKTQVGFFDGCGFAWAWPAQQRIRRCTAPCIGLTLGLPQRLESPRIMEACEPYPGRWTHHLLLTSPDELDDELLNWLDTAHAFARSRTRKKKEV